MKQDGKHVRADFLLALALVLGAVILAAISWKLPHMISAPMTSEMRGAVEEIYESYEHTRVSIKLDNNSVKFTVPIETYYAIEEQPEIGDQARIRYDLTSYREIRELKVQQEDGSFVSVYESKNPKLQEFRTKQALAFAGYGIYMVLCFALHRAIIRRRN